jgi:hypothetical protein
MSVDEALAIWLVLTIVVGYLLLAGLWCLLLPCQSRVRSTRTIYARHALEERGERTYVAVHSYLPGDSRGYKRQAHKLWPFRNDPSHCDSQATCPVGPASYSPYGPSSSGRSPSSRTRATAGSPPLGCLEPAPSCLSDPATMGLAGML